MSSKNLSVDFAGKELLFESGKLAQLANGSMMIKYGDTVILVTAVLALEPRKDVDYFPLNVEYEERLYAAGKISGSRFIKREGRPSDTAILTARLVDRSIRPLFDKNYRNDIQVVITVLSYDLQNNPDVIATIGASAALMQAGAPFGGPVGASRVGMKEGKLILNPTMDELEECELSVFVAGTKDKVLMIEAEGREIDEAKVEEAISFGHKYYQEVIKLQEKLTPVDKFIPVKADNQAITNELKKKIGAKLKAAIIESGKQAREDSLKKLEAELIEEFKEKFEEKAIKQGLNELVEKEVRRLILEDGIRPDGRGLDELRPISAEVKVLPRVHGSGLFTRGQTQALTIATLGAPGDEQMIDTMEEEGTKRYMHHYNFPPFSTGEVKPIRSVSRREIGHGALAEKALLPVIPTKEDFPYTIRLVSEILSSNGSSSMASTCGSTLALMDAGVPIKAPVAGIAIGLVSEKVKNTDKYKILTDIQGLEDFCGDMDFKIAGTEKGITAIQLDVKNDGLTPVIIHEAIQAGRNARQKVLENMKKIISAPRAELSPYAPRIYTVTIDPEKIGDVIGPGGKIINNIIAEAGGKELVAIDIEDDGTIHVSSPDKGAAKIALDMIAGITREIKVGEIFRGPITQIIKDRNNGKEIGAIVQISPNQEGMVHISQLADYHVNKIEDVVKIGDKIPVKVMEVDRDRGRISLSMKAAKGEEEGDHPKPEKTP